MKRVRTKRRKKGGREGIRGERESGREWKGGKEKRGREGKVV